MGTKDFLFSFFFFFTIYYAVYCNYYFLPSELAFINSHHNISHWWSIAGDSTCFHCQSVWEWMKSDCSFNSLWVCRLTGRRHEEKGASSPCWRLLVSVTAHFLCALGWIIASWTARSNLRCWCIAGGNHALIQQEVKNKNCWASSPVLYRRILAKNHPSIDWFKHPFKSDE